MTTALNGLRVVVTRAPTQAGSLAALLETHGAEVVAIPLIEIAAPEDGGSALRSAVQRLAGYAQIVVASPNAARVLVEAHAENRGDKTHLPPVACVGPGTAAALAGSPFDVNVVAARSVAEGLVEQMPAPAGPRSLLLVQAARARAALYDGLESLGWQVDRVVGYRTIDAEVSEHDPQRAAAADIVTFTSSSTVERFVRLLGLEATPSVVASIGPVTSATARGHGMTVDIEADPHTIEGLVAAIVDWRTDH